LPEEFSQGNVTLRGASIVGDFRLDVEVRLVKSLPTAAVSSVNTRREFGRCTGWNDRARAGRRVDGDRNQVGQMTPGVCDWVRGWSSGGGLLHLGIKLLSLKHGEKTDIGLGGVIRRSKV
jgi:hypothetical protein